LSFELQLGWRPPEYTEYAKIDPFVILLLYHSWANRVVALLYARNGRRETFAIGVPLQRHGWPRLRFRFVALLLFKYVVCAPPVSPAAVGDLLHGVR
jgi:hypothetical protein